MSGKKRLLIFFGKIASGKSYLAEACARKWGCCYHNSDVARKELAGLAASSRQTSGYDTGIYSTDFSRRTYDFLISLARKDFARERKTCVILDASYQSSAERQRICLEFAHEAKLLFVYCRCDESVLKIRMEKRLRDPNAVSDGRWEIYLRQKGRFEPPVELPADQLLTLDTDRPLEQLVTMVEKVWERKK